MQSLEELGNEIQDAVNSWVNGNKNDTVTSLSTSHPMYAAAVIDLMRERGLERDAQDLLYRLLSDSQSR